MGMQALLAVNKSALAWAKKRSGAGTSPRTRMTFGVYFYADKAELTEQPSDPDRSSGANEVVTASPRSAPSRRAGKKGSK